VQVGEVSATDAERLNLAVSFSAPVVIAKALPRTAPGVVTVKPVAQGSWASGRRIRPHVRRDGVRPNRRPRFWPSLTEMSEDLRAELGRVAEYGKFGIGVMGRVWHSALVEAGVDLEAARAWVAEHGGLEGKHTGYVAQALTPNPPRIPTGGYFLIPAWELETTQEG
jgi:hypothetical protein